MRPVSLAKVDENLWGRYRLMKDPQIRERLILENVGLVRYVAGRIAIGLPSNVSLGDLESYGIFGLIDAIDKFDPSRGVKFQTYAIARIKGAILDGLRADDPAPGAWRQKAKMLERAHRELEARLGRSATAGELAAHLGLTVDGLQSWELEVSSLAVTYLDELWHPDEDGGAGLAGVDLIADPAGRDPLSAVLLEERKKILGQAIERLSEKERLVVTLYYYEGLTAKEVAQVMGLSPSRISQLHSRAIFRLRGALSRSKDRVF